MFRITHNIQIGNFRFPQVSRVSVSSSMNNLTGICTITVPRNLRYNGNDVSKLVKRGDAVVIEAGYDHRNERLFTGYVRSVKTGIPVEIMCDDEMFNLKQVTVENAHYPSLSINKLLDKYLPAGIERKVTDVNLGEFRINDKPSLAAVLDHIKENFGLRFYFINRTFYGVLPSAASATGDATEIDFDLHVKQDNIEYLTDDELKVIVKVKTVLPNNQKLEVQEPEKATDGQVHTFLALDKKTEKELREYAKNLLVTFKPGNLRGGFAMFGSPLLRPGDWMKLFDANNTERIGKLAQVAGVEYNIGESYYEQKITLGSN